MAFMLTNYKITAQGNYLLLELISDPAEEGTGFRAEYQWLTADSMEDVSAALGKFYPELLVQTVVESDINLISEAVAYLKSYMLTIENLFHYAECLFVLEAEDGIENILYYHSVPRLKQYLYNTFDRVIYYMPQDYHTAQVIMQLIEFNNLTKVYNKLTEPLIALQINVQHIVGLEHFRPEPVIFSTIEEPLLEKMVEHKEGPAAKVVLFMVETLHRLVTGRLEFDIEIMNCPPLEATAVNLVHALENATQSLAIVMASLQGVIDTAFGPGASDIVDIYKYELIEQIHMLQHPFHVLMGARNEVLRTFTLKEEVGEPQSNHSKASNELDVEKYIKSTEPLSAAWLEYVIGENLELGILSFIQKDVEHHLLKAVPHAADAPLEDISLVAYELMTEVFHDRIVLDMPGYCLDGKLTAMLTGFLEVHLVDIAMSNLNISTMAKAIADLLLAEHTADIDGKTLESNVASKLRARLFNMFRGRLLEFDRKLEAVTRGPVSTETLPMDVVVIITSEEPRTMGELITKVVELIVPTLLVNATCTKINWTKVDDIVMEFLNSFDDLTMEVLETYEEFPLTEGINTTTADSVKALINTGLTLATDHLIYNFRHLHLVKDGVEDQSALTDFFIENLALALYNIVQMVTPYQPTASKVNVEGLMEVIEWQHNSLQELILLYMQGLRKLLNELSDDHLNLCEEYPHICKLGLLKSLTTKRNHCVSCGKN